MGRKLYLEDLALAKTLTIPNVSDILSGEDGELTFGFHFSHNAEPIKITATVLDLSDYPIAHDYMIFAADDATPIISQALQDLPSFSRKSIPQMLTILSSNLTSKLPHANLAHPSIQRGTQNVAYRTDSDDDLDDQYGDPLNEDDDDFDLDEEADNEDWLVDGNDDGDNFRSPARDVDTPGVDVVSQQRIRQDLTTAKAAGFKVGAFGSLRAHNASYLCVSCRISRLGISEEAMQAWCVEPAEYLVLLMYFPSGYRDMQFLSERDPRHIQHHLEFRTGICSSYKPGSAEQARSLFVKGNNNAGVHTTNTSVSLRETFISGPLNALFQERFPSMLRYRLDRGFSWAGAERYYIESMGKHAKASSEIREEHTIPDEPRPGLPHIVMADELHDRQGVQGTAFSVLSLPLVAMQFLLRHFVRCADFCQICHCRVGSELEAIKPYVCDNQLCLFQYLSLGFGPKVEQEILTQPLVVDLLVGFCYSAAVSRRLRELPSLDWKVPNPRLPVNGMRETPIADLHRAIRGQDKEADNSMHSEDIAKHYTASYCETECRLQFEGDVKCPLHKGDWIVINTVALKRTSNHCRVVETEYYPTVGLSKPVKITLTTPGSDGTSSGAAQGKENEKTHPKTSQLSIPPKWVSVTLHAYNSSFQYLSNVDKAASIVLMCDLLPKVTEMRDYLTARPGMPLTSWQDRIPPAALGLLRWIIASNRSAIIAVDELPADSKSSEIQLGVRKTEQRITEMPKWVQFRFAMGSPDKENRFINSLSHGHAAYPTLFAWHGSPISNWHSIIREGLDYKETSHGRAYGHGCYHAKDWMTSMGYSGMNQNNTSGSWTQSILHVNNAIALSEIVNAPEKFTSEHPYYVVQHVDWIQTRYLFAQLANPPSKLIVAKDLTIVNELPQDPRRAPTGPSSRKLELPITAVARSRRPVSPMANSSSESVQFGDRTGTSSESVQFEDLTRPSRKKAKLSYSPDDFLDTPSNPIDLDNESIATLDEDLALLIDDDGDGQLAFPNIEPCTPFTPRPLTNVPAMPPPSYATPNATRTLQKTFQTLLSVQEDCSKRSRLAELGWYTDPTHMENTENLYQWMVELHSFPLDLPLGQDMNAAGITSILMEMRFSSSFPFSPPFIRVVRPRFLPFQSGGGGHVTAGGSICMDLLTTSGWTAVASIESVLLQIRMAMMSCEPRPARLQDMQSSHHAGSGSSKGKASAAGGHDCGEYSVPEAVDAFRRACRVHGWVVPKELNEMT